MKIRFFLGFFLTFTFIIFAEKRDIDVFFKYKTGICTIIKTDDKKAALSFFSLDTSLIYPKAKFDILAQNLNFFSNHKDYNFFLDIQTAKLNLSFKSIGIKASVYDVNIQSANLKFNKTSIKEKNTNNRLFGFGYNINYLFFKHSSDWFYGKGNLSLNDLGYFIAKPIINYLWGTVQDFQLTKYYLVQFKFFNINGNLNNKYDDKIAFYKLHFFEFKNKLSFEFSKILNAYLFTSYIKGKLNFSVHLTDRNQGYFLFPYIFYNSDMRSQPSFIGFGGSLTYKVHKLSFRSDIFFYSCIYGTIQTKTHSKEKNSFLFREKKEISQSKPLNIKGSRLLYIKLSAEYKLTKGIKILADKHIPIPFYPKEATFNIPQVNTSNNIDLFLSGTCLSILIQL